jgi:hypothetical protein
MFGAQARDRTRENAEIGRQRCEVERQTRVVSIIAAFATTGAVRGCCSGGRTGHRVRRRSERICKLQDLVGIGHKHPVGKVAEFSHTLHRVCILLVVQKRLFMRQDGLESRE